MTKKSIAGIFIILFIVSFCSCKSRQHLIKPGAKASSAQHLVQLIEQAQPTFSTMNADRISVVARMGDQQMNVSARLQVKTDSVIVLSIMPFMGIEMFTLKLFRDHWQLFDRINRNFYTDNYRYFQFRYGVAVDFESLQALFSARLFSVGESPVNPRNLTFTPLQDNKNQLQFSSRTMRQTTTTHPNHSIERVLLTNATESHTLIASYHQYETTRGINFPRHINIEVLDGEQPMLGLDMRIQRVAFDSTLNLPHLNPERFTRRTLDFLLP